MSVMSLHRPGNERSSLRRTRVECLTANAPAMIPEADIWRSALAMLKRYGADAMLEAAQRADQLLDDGDMAGAEVWHLILNAIERLQAKAPAEGEAVQ